MAKTQAKVTTKQLETEELERIKLIRNSFSDLRGRFGDVTIQTRVLEGQLQGLKQKEQELIQEYELVVQNQQNVFSDLNQKYGEGAIDLEAGTFTPAE